MKILYALLLLPLALSAQDNDEPFIDVPAALKHHVPEGFTVMDTVYGNLNKDQYKDMIMVLKNVHEDVVVDDGRPLLLFLGQADGKYLLAAKK